MIERILSVALTATLLSMQGQVTANAVEPSCLGLSGCAVDQNGATTGMSLGQVMALPKGPADTGSGLVVDTSNGPRYEYLGTSACGNNLPGTPAADSLCMGAVTACSNPAGGPGPLTKIWRRLVQSGQPPGAWELVGTTCWADVVPGSRPTVSMAMIQEAFNLTPWAKPQISTQPAGNITLVGLDTYYQLNWTAEGYQPEEVDAIDPARMNGYQVDVRVELKSFIWDFGDGQTFGPTSSPGGVYPNGDITHQYLRPGTYPASVRTTFGGQFRINGGEWGAIPETVTVPGPPTTVTVRTAEAQLVSG